jgi:hypothetical protein
MLKLAEAYSVEVTESKVAIYTELLSDLSPEDLDTCCRAAAKICRFFPTPADIRAQLKMTQADAVTLEAERAWDALQKRIADFYCDESGIEYPRYQGGQVIHPPRLDSATEYAMRQCGGRYAIEYGPKENTHFVRKDFIAAYVRYRQTNGLKSLPGFHDMPQKIGDALRPLLQSKEM